jgi:ERCC4-related helicase
VLTLSLFAWFLAPHVELCHQQHRYFCTRLPSIRIRLLVGSDNVDRWSEQRTWDAALDKVRLVISTHKILEDALAHAFVKLENLSLLVFDEGKSVLKTDEVYERR